MEVSIDRDCCSNCMLCVEVCPEVFELRESRVGVLNESVPPAFEVNCSEAVELCPTRALEVNHSLDMVGR